MNYQIKDLIDLQSLSESEEVEFKLASGRDGKGALPQDFWCSYSALANTRGGWIILGIKEKQGQFAIHGVVDPSKVRADLFNQLNDRDKVSINLVDSIDNAPFFDINGKTLIAVKIRAASRKQKPVFITKSPFGNTYIRQDDGDRKCDDVTVKRMLAEQLYDSRDSEILSEHYSFEDDINQDSLKAYRNLLSAHNPQHPFLSYDLPIFFQKIGGWKKDRETGKEGVTLAGLLMFGEWEAINAAAPHYFVDYQERPEAKTELRWIDRVCPDGTWSGNLFDFYRKVFHKLTSELKIPFVLEQGQRKGDTPVHTALREALVNTLVHADYSETTSLLVVKRPDLFGFRNPGTLRIPLEDVLVGGISDCRNRILQQMFLLVGLAERAGSGMPKIFSGWQSANWRKPKLWEKITPAQTILELSTASLIPEDTMQTLELFFADDVYTLDSLELLIVATAWLEGWVNHERACQLTTQHSRDVTLALPRLVSRGFLVASGEHRQKIYTLPGVELASADQMFAGVQLPIESNENLTYNDKSSTYNGESLTYNDESSTYNDESSTYSDNNSTRVLLDFLNGVPILPEIENQEFHGNRDDLGRLLNPNFDIPFIDTVQALTPSFRDKLFDIASAARKKKRLSIKTMTEIILLICKDHYVSVSALGSILARNPNSIRQQYLSSLVESGILKLAVPQYKNDPRQGYTVARIEKG